MQSKLSDPSMIHPWFTHNASIHDPLSMIHPWPIHPLPDPSMTHPWSIAPSLRPRWQRMPSSHVFYHRSPAHSNAYVLRYNILSICSKVQPSNMGQNARTQNCDIVRIGFECLLLHPVTDKILPQLYVLCWNPQIIDSSSFLFSFAFCFDKENEVYQFAMCQPFTYSRHKVGYVWCMWDMCQPFTYSRHMVAYVTLLLYLMIIFPFQMILIAQSSQSMVE